MHLLERPLALAQIKLLALALVFCGHAAGQVDTTFTASLTGGANPAGFAVYVQPDNKILVGGEFRQVGGFTRNNIARVNADGSIDLTFTPVGYIEGNPVFGFALTPDGKVLVAGFLPRSERLFTNGLLDVSYIGASDSRDIDYLSDGKTLIGGSGALFRRFNINGTADETYTHVFVGGGIANPRIYKAALQADGKAVIVGNFVKVNNTIDVGRILRNHPSGAVDSTFNPIGANAPIITVAVQADGKILVGGEFTSFNSDDTKKYLARLNPDGSLDTSFSPVLNAPVLALKQQTDGKILIGGSMSTVNGILRPGIARLNLDGTLDSNFSAGTGTNGPVWSIDQQSDGKIIYAGQFTQTNGIQTLGIGRLLNANVPRPSLFDYDGDSKSDVSVFRPSENRWYVFRSSDSVVAQAAFAITGDVPVPADYDGDLKTDIAIYRPSNGAWWYLSSLNGAQINVNWGGEAGDIPRPSDFDGDGKTDFVFFRPTNNFWYRINASGTVSNVQFGSTGDKPVRGDFDGDGKSDVAIFRPSTGDWWYKSSIYGTQLAVRWGISTDIPAPADFDGDGRTDFAVYRPSTGVWYIINSSNGSFTIGPFGLTEDRPVPADYDGDGKAELAVFRPSTGVWYQLRSSGGFFAMQFGIGSDTPTPNAFVP